MSGFSSLFRSSKGRRWPEDPPTPPAKPNTHLLPEEPGYQRQGATRAGPSLQESTNWGQAVSSTPPALPWSPPYETVDALDFKRFKVSNPQEPADGAGMAAKLEGPAEEQRTASRFSPLDKVVLSARRLSKKLDVEQEATGGSGSRGGYETAVTVGETETEGSSVPVGRRTYETTAGSAKPGQETAEGPRKPKGADVPSVLKGLKDKLVNSQTPVPNEPRQKEAVEELEDEFVEFQLQEIETSFRERKWDTACEILNELLDDDREGSAAISLVQTNVLLAAGKYRDAHNSIPGPTEVPQHCPHLTCFRWYLLSQCHLGLGQDIAAAAEYCEKGLNMCKKEVAGEDWPVSMDNFLYLMASIQDARGNKMKAKFFRSRISEAFKSRDILPTAWMMKVLREELGAQSRPEPEERTGASTSASIVLPEVELERVTSTEPSHIATPQHSTHVSSLRPLKETTYDRQGVAYAVAGALAPPNYTLLTRFDKALSDGAGYTAQTNPFLLSMSFPFPIGLHIAQCVCEINGRTALHYAVFRDKPDIVATLLKLGASPYIRDHEGYSPLHIAAMYARKQTSSLILDPGAYVDNLRLMEILHLAAHRGNARFLTAWAADTTLVKPSLVNGLDGNGETPLMLACYAGSFECAKVLLHLGADTMVQQDDGDTALHIAAKSGHPELFLLLLINRALLWKRNKAGKRPSECAADERTRNELVRWENA